MKIHNDFTLYFRVVPSGKRVVYYYAYDEDGKRINGKSTGEITLTAARIKCNRLLKMGTLIPKRGYIPTFAEYSVDWWDWEKCDYIKKRRKRSNLTKKYADNSKWVMDKVLLPYFGGMHMDRISQEVVEAFVDSYIQKGYKHTTINCYFSIMKTMLIEAEERKVIANNPIMKMGKLINNRKEIEIITQDEFKKLFVGDWMKVWDNDRIAYTANKLAALTGMRAAEVIGLKGCYVFDEHLFLCMQYDSKYGYRPTKTKDKCNIPLPASMIADLNELKKINGDGFLFSTDGGGKPVSKLTVYLKFHKALVNIGIPKEQIAERKLHLHAWRHFFNTELLKGGLSVKQTQAITRHRSEQMTDSYAHFEPSDFIKAKEVQDALLQPSTENTVDKLQADGTAEGRLTVLQFPATQDIDSQERKQA